MHRRRENHATAPNIRTRHNQAWIGRSLRRREDDRLVEGKGSYTGDIRLENPLYAAFVRSPVACGNIERLDWREAARMPGVSAIFGAEDVADLGQLSVNGIVEDIAVPQVPLLAREELRATGQPIAMVLAETEAGAKDAAEAVSVDFEAGTAHIGPPVGTEKLEWGDRPGRVALSQKWQRGDCSKAFEGAARIVECAIEHSRLSPSSLEPRCIAVEPDTASGGVTVWLSTQTPHRARAELAAILDLPETAIRLVAPDIGGAFGSKASVFPEEILSIWAALRLGRNVKWAAARSEEFLSGSHARGARSRARLALDENGRFLALEADFTFPVGHWMTTSAAVPAWNASRILPGPYSVEHVSISARGVLSNTAPVGIYRGAGRPEAALLMEYLVQKAAAACDLDPFEMRRRNAIDPREMPHHTPTGQLIDSGDYCRALELVEERAKDQIAGLADRRRNGEMVGLGLALFIEPSGQGWESARVQLHENGDVTAATGGSSQGHGRETAISQIIADVLDVEPDRVSVLHGDSAACPAGIGAVASRSTPIGGSALVAAAEIVRDKAARGNHDFPISGEIRYSPQGEAWGSGCYLAIAAVDPETGEPRIEKLFALDDAGRLINPLLAEGQVMGGIAQGIGEALMERVCYDPAGQLVTGSLMDYALPRASDMPPLDLQTMETPSPFNLLGAKGVGEAGTIGAVSAIFNAVNDALAVRDCELACMPMTAARIWEAMNIEGKME